MLYAVSRHQQLHYNVFVVACHAALLARIHADDCDEHFKLAEAWQPSFDRAKIDDYMFYGFSAQRADEAPFLIRDSTGLYIRPSLDVRLNGLVPPTCPFRGSVWLATNPFCNKDEREKTEVKEIEGNSFEGYDRRWQLTFTDRRLLMEGSHATHYRDFKVNDLSLTLYLCVQPGPDGSHNSETAIKRPLHMVWYFQSSDDARVKAIKNDGKSTTSGWRVAFSETGEHGTSEHSDMPAYSHMLRYYWQDSQQAAAN